MYSQFGIIASTPLRHSNAVTPAIGLESEHTVLIAYLHGVRFHIKEVAEGDTCYPGFTAIICTTRMTVDSHSAYILSAESRVYFKPVLHVVGKLYISLALDTLLDLVFCICSFDAPVRIFIVKLALSHA